MHFRPMLNVRDVPRTSDFYRTALGFEIIESYDGGAGLAWCTLKKGTAEIMLARGPVPELRNEGIALYFYPASVAELERLHASLEAHGHDVSSLEDTPYGHRLFVLKDPDGYRLSFGRSTSE